MGICVRICPLDSCLNNLNQQTLSMFARVVSTHLSGLLACGMRPGTAASRCCSCDFCRRKGGGGQVELELCIEVCVKVHEETMY